MCATVCSASADVVMPNVFGSNMVLQREMSVPVWGTATPGEKVSVEFAGQNLSTISDKDGKWLVKLAPMVTSKSDRTMTVKGSNTITFSNVLVGEVWFCSGQSNMAGKFVASKGRSISDEDFKRDFSSYRFSNWNGGWNALSKDTQNGISCVAYFFGRELYDEIDAPLGLVIRSWSGTPIQAWLPAEEAEKIRKELDIPEGWNNMANPQQQPGAQFMKGVDPIAPFAIRGAIWYQGERNAKTYTGWEYRHLLPHMVKTWRELWAERAGTELRKFPFYSVQVPVQAEDGEWPWLRDAFRRSVDTIENSGIAVFYDYGPAVHPPNKEPSGQRLALWALAKDYGKDIVCCGPLLDEVKVKGSKATLTFNHVGGGLKSKSGGEDLKFFEIAGKDGKYAAADATIEGDTVVVTSKGVSKPVYVRYLFRKAVIDPELSLINAEGLPASSFITDDFRPERPTREELTAAAEAAKAKAEAKASKAKAEVSDEERNAMREKRRAERSKGKAK